jgi:hypothetical protein
VWALSALHLHTTGYATWVTLESRLHNTGAHDHSVGLHPPVILLFIHISHFFCPLSFISQSKSSLWTPNYQAYQDLFNFDGGGNRRKPPVRDPRRKSLLYRATYLVPRAGIEPTPRTDIGYRPLSPTRQNRSATTYPPSTDLYYLTVKNSSCSSWVPLVIERRIEPGTFRPVIQRLTKLAVLSANFYLPYPVIWHFFWACWDCSCNVFLRIAGKTRLTTCCSWFESCSLSLLIFLCRLDWHIKKKKNISTFHDGSTT